MPSTAPEPSPSETRLASFDEVSADEAAAVAPGEYVVLDVSNTSCGAPSNILEHIFEPFFTTKGSQVAGLGLATVYGIVKQNSGFLSAASEPELGCVLRITLPAHHLPLAQPVEESPRQVQHGAGETILVVDNDADILELTEVMLGNQGYIQGPQRAFTESDAAECWINSRAPSIYS